MKSVLNSPPAGLPGRPLNRRTVLQGLLAPALGALVAGCGGAAARWEKVAKQLQGLLDAETGNAGVYSAIGRLEIGSEVVFAGAAGTYSDVDRTAVRADTPFRAASVGKMFTAVAVLKVSPGYGARSANAYPSAVGCHPAAREPIEAIDEVLTAPTIRPFGEIA